MSSSCILQDMMTQYCRDDWSSSACPDMEKWREILTVLTDRQKLQVLQQHYPVRRRPLQCAAIRGHTEIISTLLTSLQSSAYRLKLLMVGKRTPLHLAAWRGHTESLKIILDCLTADQQIQITSVHDKWDGVTAIQCAERCGHTDTMKILREYQHRAENQKREEYSKLIIHSLYDSPCVRFVDIKIFHHHCRLP